MTEEEFKKVIQDLFYSKRIDPNTKIPISTLGNMYKKLRSKNKK